MMASTSTRQQTVAVIGLGGMGLVAVKNLLEEGFDVTGFERSAYVGGLWHYTDDKDTLSVLQNTQANVSSDRACYTDYPFPKGTPAFASAKDMENYLESYADHFGLRPRLQLNAAVSGIIRPDESDKWRIDLDGMPSRYFDKVVLATGPHARPSIPDIADSHLFTGQVIHSKAFKRPAEFEGKRVIIIGLGNTSGDVADALVGVASSVAIAHSHGAVILPRKSNGQPASRMVTQRRVKTQGLVDKIAPNAMEWAVNTAATSLMKKAFGEPEPSWGLLDSPTSLKVAPPIVSDTLVDHLRSRAVRSVAGIRRITGPAQIELNNGEEIEADVIICCTGYQNDFRLIDSRFNPAAEESLAWAQAPGSKGRPLPRLYQNVFSLQAPDSLAFLGCVWFPTGAFGLADLASMCIAQVWAGKSTLPPAAEMARWMDAQEKHICDLARRGTPVPASVPQMEWLVWADKTAGAGLFDRLGWGCKGWKFWWQDRQLWRLVMDGLLTSASWRLFDEGKRKPWDGARAEIVRLNEEAEAAQKPQE